MTKGVEELAVYRDLTAAALEACLEREPDGRERLAAYQAMDKLIADLPEPEPEWWLRNAFYQAIRSQTQPCRPSIMAMRALGSVAPIIVLLGLVVWLLWQQTELIAEPTVFACPVSPTEQIWMGTGPMAGEFPVWMTSGGANQGATLLSTASGKPERVGEGPWGRSLLLVDEDVVGDLMISGRQLDGAGEVYFLQHVGDEMVEPQLTITDAHTSVIAEKPGGRVQHIIAWGVTNPGCYELRFSLAEYTVPIVVQVTEVSPTPSPTATQPAFVENAFIRLDSLLAWSPGGELVAYWQHSTTDIEANPQLPPGQLMFYSTSTDATCRLPAVFGYDGIDGSYRRYMWRGDSFRLVRGRDLLVVPNPCQESHTTLTNFFPEVIEEVVAVHRLHVFYLLRGQEQYWLYNPFVSESMRLLPVDGIRANEGNSYAISPFDNYLAINKVGGGTVVVETATGRLKSTIEWSGSQAVLPPVWLSADMYLIQKTTGEAGPLLATVEGKTRPVAELFGLPPVLEQRAQGVYIGFGRYAILLRQINQAGERKLYLYHAETGEVEILPFDEAAFDPNGRWLFLQQNGEDTDGASELWWRSIEPAQSLVRPLTSHEERIYWTTTPVSDLVGPVSELVTVSAGNWLLVVTAEGMIRLQTLEGEIVGQPLRSPGGHYLAMVVERPGEVGNELLVLPIR